jgi:hypothetical protein
MEKYVEAAHENEGNELLDLLILQHDPKRFVKQLKARLQKKERPRPADPPSKLSRLKSLFGGRGK